MNAYMLFTNETRAALKTKNPDASMGEMGKLSGEAWKAMGAEEKKVWEDKAAAEKVRYAAEIAAAGPDEGDGDDVAGKPAKKKAKSTTTTASSSSSSAPKRAKVLKPAERLEEVRMAYKWWEAPSLPEGIKWKYMEHMGLNFSPVYVPHGIPLLYDGSPVTLGSAAEEIATMFAGINKTAQQLSNPKFAKVFKANFWKDFSKALDASQAGVIKDFLKCDFSLIAAHVEAAREIRKNMSKEQKEAEKEKKAAIDARTAYALVDGHLEKIGNCTVEPPGLFRGRGEHPKMGCLKRRIMPEEITINCAPGAPVPPCPLPGHSWKHVQHDPSVTWLAGWMDPVGGHNKYVYLAASSSLKQQSDVEKYDKARQLCKNVDRIRGHYEKLLNSSEDVERQLGTCMWIIDRLALRVGGEKEVDEADTVGTCSLRPEHLRFPSPTEIEFDFLGKDSMRYNNTIDISRYKEVGLRVHHNLRKLCKGKDPVNEDVFDLVDPSRLNKELSELMPGLSAKVFRTYNASITLQKELELLPISLSAQEKKNEYDRANRQVAILCNHQKTVSKGVEDSLTDMKDKIGKLREQLVELENARKNILIRKGGETGGLRLKPDEDTMEVEKDARAKAFLAAAVAAAASEGRELTGKTLEAASSTANRKANTLVKDEHLHLFTKPPSVEQLEKRIDVRGAEEYPP